ncbi:cytochrome P450 [Cubamyces sp. BRFM 1775]|nr:cytochrome P450 [Cubamyces sp. BRFM 1775]
MSGSVVIVALACVLGTLAVRHICRSLYSVYMSQLGDLRGPQSPSVFYGHVNVACKAGNSTVTQQWIAQYGTNVLCRWLCRIPCLWTADPAVIRHVLCSDKYVKPLEARISAAQIIGNGILVSEGAKHRGQRSIMSPAFGSSQIRDLMHIFVHKSAELRDIWADEISKSGGCARINGMDGLQKLTLDVISLAGFGLDLKALNKSGESNEIDESFCEIFSAVPPVTLYRVLMDWFPSLDFFPDERTKKIRHARAVIRRIGVGLIREKKAAIQRELDSGNGVLDKKDLPGKDLLTLLIRANMATNLADNQRLTDEEVLSQIPTFLVAGHESTTITTAWCLFALTQNIDIQQKLREELLSVQTDSPTMDDLASLPYLDCVVRETLRLYTPVVFTLRAAAEDDVIPLSEPIIDRHGKTQREIRIAAGNRVIISILEPHHSKAIWGDDALEFRPERWDNLPEEASRIPSIWGNVLAFAAGPHSCIGYRFAIAEIKAVIFTLVREFVFELGVAAEDVTAVGMLTQRPALKSEPEVGPQLPLLVRPYMHAVSS